MKQLQLTEHNGHWAYADAPQYGVSVVNSANGVFGILTKIFRQKTAINLTNLSEVLSFDSWALHPDFKIL